MQSDRRPRILADFEGSWRLERHIAHADGTEARFDGVAVWSADSRGLAYHESGSLRITDAPAMQAERRYLWTADLDVYFEDGRFFHRVPDAGGEADHWCDPDRYVVRYDFSSWPAFTAVWQVSGPKKCYRLRSHYRRC
ncbi:MAG: DUF6314 family protein [Pseudomonadota bacterium]